MRTSAMTSPAVIAVAITGSVPRKKDNPALAVTVTEQMERARRSPTLSGRARRTRMRASPG